MLSLSYHSFMVPRTRSSILSAGLLAFFLAFSPAIELLEPILGYGRILNAVAEDSALQAQTSDGLNAVLLLDSSASMLINDPEKLRDQGARLFLQFLKSGDRLAIVRFDETATTLRPLSPFSSDQLPALQTLLASIEATGQYTDLNAGLTAAQGILSKMKAGDGNPVIIILSDGKMDPSPQRGSAESHLDELSTRLLPALKMSGLKVYTLAFSQDADRPLLQHIAQATDGVNWFTPNSDTIHESFADLFLSLKKPQVVAYGARGFKIDNDIEEATFYINQPENVKVEIEDPNQERFSAAEPGENIRWFDGKKFSVITITEPDSGEWKLIGVNPDDGFATILTNLKLVTDWPNSIALDSSVLLRARLYEGKIPVDLEAMAQAVSFAFQITPSDRVSEPIVREFLSDDGKEGDERELDGVFSRRVKIQDAGEYRLRVIAKGPTFERQLQIPFRVRPPLVSFSIQDSAHAEQHHKEPHAKVPVDGHAEEEHAETGASETGHKQEPVAGSDKSVFHINLAEDAATFKNVVVSVAAVDKERNKVVLAARQIKDEHGGSSLAYEVIASSLPKDGTYELKANVKAETRNGKSVVEESEPIKFTRVTEVKPQEIGAAPEVVEQAKVEAPVEKGFDWLALILVTVINVGLGAALFVLIKKKKSSSGATSFELPPMAPEILAALEELEKRAQIDSVNFDDARFSGVEAEVASSPPESSTSAVAAE